MRQEEVPLAMGCWILFIGWGRARFQDIDHDILASRYEVKRLQFVSLRKTFADIGLMELGRQIRASSLIVCWFGGPHGALFCLLGRLFSRPSIVIGGGGDVVLMPEIRYGIGIRPIGRLYAAIAFHLCTRVVVNSNDSKEVVIRNYRVAREKVEVMYHGVDTFEDRPEWKYESKQHLAITVGTVSKGNLSRKGIESFVRAAVFLPAVKFEVIGKWMDNSVEYLKKISSSNVTFRNYVTDAELVEAYRRAKVVVQASYHEGFGCALAEAMSYGCVPVVTRRGALPEVVGDTGYYVEYGDVQALGSAIAKALEDCDKAFAASKRARALFTINERRKRLFELVETLMRSSIAEAVQVSPPNEI